MQYRQFGKLDWEVSALGFGAMRLPIIDDDQAKIDESEAIGMIRRSIDHGVNYLDTAYVYHGGNSEVLVGKALSDGYREKIRLATKMPSWFIEKYEDYDRFLQEQLDRLKTDHIDFYLLHGMGKRFWPSLRDKDVIKWAEGAIADGRIGHIGYSFHDTLEVFKEIVDAYDGWTFCQIQYNFMDIEYQAGAEGLKYAADKGMAVVVMEPLRGGGLAKEPPESVAKVWKKTSSERSPVDWALQWLWNQPEVSVVLSGMTTMRHVEENLASADISRVGALTDDDLSIIDQVREAYRKISPIPCTNCQYCMPCTNGVNIPVILRRYNEGYMYDDHRVARMRYNSLPRDEQGDQCIECLECEEKCPQEIQISEWLKKCHDWLGLKPKS